MKQNENRENRFRISLIILCSIIHASHTHNKGKSERNYSWNVNHKFFFPRIHIQNITAEKSRKNEKIYTYIIDYTFNHCLPFLIILRNFCLMEFRLIRYYINYII